MFAVDMPCPQVCHTVLDTTFNGILHPSTTTDIPIHQFRGIRYATVPARFRQSKLCSTYARVTDASRYGPICPQPNIRTIAEDMVGLPESEMPKLLSRQDEFECLNLNITRPGGVPPSSRLPVMIWIHGGGDRGSGSNWIYDAGNLVRKGVQVGKPVMVVTLNFRIGLFGFAASPLLREDNKLWGELGVGNYGLRDQRRAMEWVHRYIADFGGDPFNVTLFGESSGAADILSHLSSNANQTRPLFHRAIVQSAIIDHNVPDVHCAGWYLSRVMSTLGVSTLDQLRILDAEKLAAIGHPLRVTYDGVFLLPGWRASLQGKESASRRQHLAESNLNTPARGLRPAPPCPAAARCAPAQFQPLIIGDSSNESLVWARLASCWTIAGVSRRLRAVCQSPSKAAMLLRGYSICEANPDDVAHRVLELINDTRVAWPTDCAAEMAKRERGGRHVWRYLFDQEGPARGIPHHAADLVYLFDNVPHSAFATCASPCLKRSYSDWIETSQDVEELKLKLEDHDGHEEYSLRPGDCAMHDKYDSDEDDWSMPHVDEWSFNRVRDAIQERWICFANGEAPWSEDSVFVFGPEGETGERPKSTLDERRRRDTWKTALEPLGMRLAQKVGMELSNGPSIGY